MAAMKANAAVTRVVYVSCPSRNGYRGALPSLSCGTTGPVVPVGVDRHPLDAARCGFLRPACGACRLASST
ncbi:MAG: hypothetical protein ACLSVD_16655 [Eggerthellaceae bacterium]